jgi:2-phosphoglycerate kinase
VVLDRSWTVLLVGGNAGSGKTTASRAAALSVGVPLTQVDDVRLALQAATSPRSHRALHAFVTDPNVWQRPTPELLELFLSVGRAVAAALEPVIAHHAYSDLPLILEGDGLLPRFARQGVYAGYRTDRIRAVFLVESDEDELWGRAVARGRGFTERSPAEQAAEIRLSVAFASWLTREAEEFGLPVIPSRPVDTAVQRVLAAASA